MPNFLALPGLSGHFADTPDLNLFESDDAHVQQSPGNWDQNTGPVPVLSSDVTALFGDFTIKTAPSGFVNIIKTPINASLAPPASAGQVFAFAADIQVANPLAGRGIATIIDFRDASDVGLGLTTGAAVTVTADTWHRTPTVTATAPANTTYIRLFVVADGGVMDGTETFYNDRFTLRSGTDATWVPSLRIVGDLEYSTKLATANLASSPLFIDAGAGATPGTWRAQGMASAAPRFTIFGLGNFDGTPGAIVDGETATWKLIYVAATGVWTWTKDGAPAGSGTTAIDALSGAEFRNGRLTIGMETNGVSSPFGGDIDFSEVRDGIVGPVVARFDAGDFAIGDGDLVTAIGSVDGRTWTLHGSASLIQTDEGHVDHALATSIVTEGALTP